MKNTVIVPFHLYDLLKNRYPKKTVIADSHVHHDMFYFANYKGRIRKIDLINNEIIGSRHYTEKWVVLRKIKGD